MLKENMGIPSPMLFSIYHHYDIISMKASHKCSEFTFGEGVFGGISRAGLEELGGSACKIHSNIMGRKKKWVNACMYLEIRISRSQCARLQG